MNKKENNFTNYWKSILPLVIDKKYYIILSGRSNGKEYALKEIEKHAKKENKNR